MNTMSIDEAQAEEGERLVISSERVTAILSRSHLLVQRLRAVRSEIINALSFLSILLTLREEQELSVSCFLFLLSGFLILLIDCYFIHCQWSLQKNHALPLVCTSCCNSPTTRSVGALDDILSDLPQTVWVLCYLFTFKFSFIAMVCTLHSMFSLLEGVLKLYD